MRFAHGFWGRGVGWAWTWWWLRNFLKGRGRETLGVLGDALPSTIGFKEAFSEIPSSAPKSWLLQRREFLSKSQNLLLLQRLFWKSFYKPMNSLTLGCCNPNQCSNATEKPKAAQPRGWSKRSSPVSQLPSVPNSCVSLLVDSAPSTRAWLWEEGPGPVLVMECWILIHPLQLQIAPAVLPHCSQG